MYRLVVNSSNIILDIERGSTALVESMATSVLRGPLPFTQKIGIKGIMTVSLRFDV